MGTEKRERQKAQRAARLEAERKAAARKRQIRTLITGAVVVAGVILLLFLLSSCSSSSGSNSSAKVPKGCPPLEGASTPKLDFTAKPPLCIDPKKTYAAKVTTTMGTFTIDLDTKRTPNTANNFVFLSRWGYYDNTQFFRTEKASGIIQGGSPHTQNNQDTGPGYTIRDEGGRRSQNDYVAGAIAMARPARSDGTVMPNSAGAEFFLLANQGGRYLGDPGYVGKSAGSYVVFGHVSKGLPVLVRIANLDNGQQVPRAPVKIVKIQIVES